MATVITSVNSFDIFQQLDLYRKKVASTHRSFTLVELRHMELHADDCSRELSLESKRLGKTTREIEDQKIKIKLLKDRIAEIRKIQHPSRKRMRLVLNKKP